MKRLKTAAAQELGKWLSSLKRSRSMVWRSGSRQWTGEVLARLQGWCASIEDPRDGCDLLLRFFAGDEALFSFCDDSNGDLGNLFRGEAKAMFVEFAKACPDKEGIAADLSKLLRDDGYGVRDCLLEGAREFLPEPVLRTMVERFRKEADSSPDEDGKRHRLMLVEMLAKELKDPVLFEQTRLGSWGEGNPAAHLEIARVWFDAGDPDAARKWLDSVPVERTFMVEERDDLLVRVAAVQGDIATRDAAAWRRFRRFRDRKSLEELLVAIGSEEPGRVVEEEAGRIQSIGRLVESDALFLLEMGLADDAERYLFDRIAQVSGDRYGETLDLAEAAVHAGKPLLASLLYRALLDSILVHVRRTAYRHGAKYLAILARLARSVEDWQGHPSHESYFADLRARHGLKKAFWALVG